MRLSVGCLIAAIAAAQQPSQQVLHFAHTQDTRNAQEIATVIRTIPEIRDVKLSDDDPPSTLTITGTPEQIAAAGWLLAELDQSAPSPEMREYKLSGTRENVVRIYHVVNARSLQEFQEIATAARTVGEIRRVITYDAPKQVVMRGTASQLAMAEWLFNELDQPPAAQSQAASPHEYRAPGPDDVVRVFYLAHAGAGQEVQSIVPQIRSATTIQRAFSYGARMGLVLRGTAAQIAAAEHLVQELDKP